MARSWPAASSANSRTSWLRRVCWSYDDHSRPSGTSRPSSPSGAVIARNAASSPMEELPAVCSADSGALDSSSGTIRRRLVTATATATSEWLTAKKTARPATAPGTPPPVWPATSEPSAVAAPKTARLNCFLRVGAAQRRLGDRALRAVRRRSTSRPGTAPRQRPGRPRSGRRPTSAARTAG